eukprot:5366489-Prymnesium_polylepis.1
MNHPPRSETRAARASASARVPTSGPSDAVPAPAQPPCLCCGGSGVAPPLVRARFECSACGG